MIQEEDGTELTDMVRWKHRWGFVGSLPEEGSRSRLLKCWVKFRVIIETVFLEEVVAGEVSISKFSPTPGWMVIPPAQVLGPPLWGSQWWESNPPLGLKG